MLTRQEYGDEAPDSCIIIAPKPEIVNAPADLRSRARWVLWRSEPDPKPKKVPYQASGWRASSTNPRHWTSWKHAEFTARVRTFDGLAFAVGDGVVGVDLDHVRDRETGAVAHWAQRVITYLATYTEISPSGTGFHIFFLGRKPAGRSNMRFPDDHTAFEIYDQAHFLSVTGQHVPQTPLALRQVPDCIVSGIYDSMLARLPEKPKSANLNWRSDEPVELDDKTVVRLLLASRCGSLEALWHGDHRFESHSDADLALCGSLAFWTAKNPAQIDRLFRQSGLMRPKWDERRGGDSTYGRDTIALAISRCTSTFGGRRRG